MGRETELLRSVWAEIQTLLQNEKKRIYSEIRNYPPPIAGCDQQYDHLLEERTRISQELHRAGELSERSLVRRELIDNFVKASSFIGDEAKQQILSRLKEGRSGNR